MVAAWPRSLTLAEPRPEEVRVKLPALPESKELARELPSDVLYKLERVGEISRQILDERIVVWAGEGWPQHRIAKEIGCSQQAVGQRMARLGIEPAQPHRPRSNKQVVTSTNGAPRDEIEFSPDAEGICPVCHGTGRVPIEQLLEGAK